MIKIAVCDDERYFRERMNKILTEYMEEKGYSYDITGFKSGEEFLYVESRLHKVIFFVMEDGIKEYHMYDKLDNIDKRLTQYNFYRIHQSFLVNMRYVKKWNATGRYC